MRGINRYILRQVLGSTVFVTVGLTCAIWLSQSLRLIDLIVNKGVSFWTFSYMAMLLLPSFLGIILPIALFCAVMFTYNKLHTDSELVVMRAAGLSQLDLARPALLVAAGVMVVCYGLSLYLLPAAYREFKDMQYRIRSDHTLVMLREGVFNTISDEVTVYVRAREPNGELQGILIHDERMPDKPVTMMAENGAMVQTETGPRVIMVNGNRQEVEKETGKLSLLYFDRYTLDVSDDSQGIKNRYYEPRERFLPELFNPGNSPDEIKNRHKLRAEGHQRLIGPIYALSFVCVGLAALLAGEFTRRGQARRVLIASVVVAVSQAGGLGLQNIAAKAPEVVPLMYLNGLVPIAAGLFLVMRTPRRRPTPEAAAAAPGAG